MKQKPDGFRVIVFVRAGSVVVQSRRGANLAPGFPEIAEAASAIGEDVVLNGELVVAYQDRLDFTELQRRASRTGRGAARATLTRPAHVIVFDVLEADGVELLDRRYRERRARLEDFSARREVISATENQSISFHQIRTEDGGRIRYRRFSGAPRACDWSSRSSEAVWAIRYGATHVVHGRAENIQCVSEPWCRAHL